jgi:hypothetical protein
LALSASPATDQTNRKKRFIYESCAPSPALCTLQIRSTVAEAISLPGYLLLARSYFIPWADCKPGTLHFSMFRLANLSHGLFRFPLSLLFGWITSCKRLGVSHSLWSQDVNQKRELSESVKLT